MGEVKAQRQFGRDDVGGIGEGNQETGLQLQGEYPPAID